MQRSRVLFDETAHTYYLDGRYLKGVTGLVKKVFPDLYSGIPESVLMRAAERGRLIHKEIEIYEVFGVEGETPEFFAYMKAKEQHGFKVLESEFLVNNDNYATMCDEVVDLDGLSLIDLKTTSVLNLEYLSWQLSITAFLFEGQTGEKIEHLYGLHLRGNHFALKEVRRRTESEIKALMQADMEGYDFIPVLDEDFLEVAQNDKIAEIADLEQAIIDLKFQITEAENIKTRLQEGLLEQMKKAGMKKVETERIMITYVEPSERTTLDSKLLKEQEPEIFEKYAKTQTIKEQIRIKLK